MRQAIDSSELEEGLLRARAVAAFESVVGPHIAARCGRAVMERDVIVVPVASASLRHELSLARTSIVADINSRLRRPIVGGLRFIAK